MKEPLAKPGEIVLRSKLVGVTFEGRQANIRGLHYGSRLFWRREPENPFDANAVLVFSDIDMTRNVGRLSRAVAAKVAGWVAEGRSVTLSVKKVTGGTVEHKTLGVNIYLRVV